MMVRTIVSSCDLRSPLINHYFGQSCDRAKSTADRAKSTTDKTDIYLLTLIFISVAFSPRPLRTGIYFQTLLSPLLKVPRMVLLSSLLR